MQDVSLGEVSCFFTSKTLDRALKKGLDPAAASRSIPGDRLVPWARWEGGEA